MEVSYHFGSTAVKAKTDQSANQFEQSVVTQMATSVRARSVFRKVYRDRHSLEAKFPNVRRRQT